MNHLRKMFVTWFKILSCFLIEYSFLFCRMQFLPLTGKFHFSVHHRVKSYFFQWLIPAYGNFWKIVIHYYFYFCVKSHIEDNSVGTSCVTIGGPSNPFSLLPEPFDPEITLDFWTFTKRCLFNNKKNMLFSPIKNCFHFFSRLNTK